jgi:hypothetical protein
MERLSVKFPFALMLLVNLAITHCASAQATEPNQTPPAGVPTSAPPQSPASSSSSQSPPVVDRPVSWKLLLPNILNDQERIWFPSQTHAGSELDTHCCHSRNHSWLVRTGPNRSLLFSPQLVISGQAGDQLSASYQKYTTV